MGVKTYTGPDGGAQKLSRTARAKRNKDNIAKASEQYRIDRRGDNHKLGQRSDSDLHHTKSGTVVRTTRAYNIATNGPNHRNEVKS